MKTKESTHIVGVNDMKLLLILGVVLIHSNIAVDYTAEIVNGSRGLEFVDWMSAKLCSGCVPLFFVLSGYLFFNNIKKFTWQVYCRKVKSRITTLLIPYIFWCTVMAVALYVKHRFLHMSGLGIFLDDGSVNWVNFIKGYWCVSVVNMPFAFAFWFIRNLMVFVLLSPLAFLLGRNILTTLLPFALILIFHFDFYGFEWFVAGAFLCRIRFMHRHFGVKYVISATIVFIGCGIMLEYVSLAFYLIVKYAMIAAEFIVLIWLGRKMTSSKSKPMKMMESSVFMIYAVHQCFCTKTRYFWTSVFGISNFMDCILAYLCSFVILVSAGILAEVVLQRVAPRFLDIITGGRSEMQRSETKEGIRARC